MWPYWVMFLLPAVAALGEPARLMQLLGNKAVLPTIRGAWWAVLLTFSLPPRVRIEVASLWELLCEHWGHHPAAEGGVGGAGSTGRSP